jgi:hypothetical protein
MAKFETACEVWLDDVWGGTCEEIRDTLVNHCFDRRKDFRWETCSFIAELSFRTYVRSGSQPFYDLAAAIYNYLVGGRQPALNTSKDGVYFYPEDLEILNQHLREL